MKMIRVLIVDDERYAREELRFLLNKFSQVDIVGEIEKAEETVMKVIEKEPDVVFLDVEMPKINGIEVAKSLKKLKKVPHIIFATAYPDFAVEAFRINAADYLLKPYDLEPLTDAINRVTGHLTVENQSNHHQINKLAIENDGEIEYVYINDIKYIYPDGKICNIHTGKDIYQVKSSLKELEQKLSAYQFFRIHRGYVVNLNDVKRLTPWFNGAYEVELEGIKDKLPVSRNYAKALQKRLSM